MNPHDRRRRHGPDEPVAIGTGLRDVETRLRTALGDEARSVRPGERLDAILVAAHSDSLSVTGGPPSSRGHWQVLAAAAAALAIVAGVLWAAGRPTSTSTPAATPTSVSPTATSPSTPSPRTPTTGSAPTVSGTPGARTSGPAVPTVGTQAVPAYFLGPRAPGSGDLRLFREFVRTEIVLPVTPARRTEAALRAVMSSAPAASGYTAMWRGVELGSVSVSPTTITVPLSRGLTRTAGEGSQLAVQQLVWTAQAAVGQGRIPVRFELASGREVAPGLSADATYSVPTGMDQYSEIATIWIDHPSQGEVLEAGRPVMARGVGTVFEATVAWQLLRGDAEVDGGFANTSQGAPERGTWEIELGRLPAGDYTLRVIESSAKDGSVATEARVRFSAR